MAYVIPQVLVFQEFTQVADVIVDPLRAFITGPNYNLIRYTETTEKESGNLGAYTPDSASVTFSWPNLPAGGVVDTTYTRLFIEKAHLQYANWATGVAGGAQRNYVRHPGLNGGFVAFTNPVTGTVYPRDPVLLRDVKVGDVVNVKGDTAADDITAKVIGFANDKTAAVTASATADTGNSGALTAAQTSTTVTSTGDTTIGTLGTAYDGLASGDLSETYTVTVTQGGAPTSARLSVVSASGRDDISGVVPAAFASATTIGSRGFTVIFNTTSSGVFTVNDKWTFSVNQDYGVLVATSNGTYTGPTDTTYNIEVTKGGPSGTAQVTVSTTTGIDASGPHTITTSTPINIGSYGIQFAGTTATYGYAKGEKFHIVATAAADGSIKTLILSKNLTNDMFVEGYQNDMALTLFIEKDLEVESCDGATGVVNWTQSATELTINVGGQPIQGYDSEWIDSGGNLVPLPIRSGTVYVHYRSLLQTYASAVQTIIDIADVATTLGTVHSDNPLAMGVYKALTNANGTEVKYMAVPTDDLAGYSKVVDELVGREDTYGLVPLTHDKQIQDLFQAHADAMSTPTVGRWRTAWFGAKESLTKQIGLEATGTISDDANTSGTQYTDVRAVGATFQDDGVQPLDILRTNFTTDQCGKVSYTDYQISSVVNNESLLLTAGPVTGVTVGQKMEIWRNLSKDEQATEIGKLAGAFNNRRVRMVWPDQGGNAGAKLSSYYVAAALAGLRSGVVPHQGLTNVQVAGFDDVRGEYFNSTQLNTLAENGVWIVTQDPASGDIFSRHQVTSGDNTIIDDREDSIVTNVDSISFFMRRKLAPFIGKANVTPETLALLTTQIMSAVSFLKVSGHTSTLGGQLIDASILELKAHPTLQDRVIARVDITIPRPMNNIELTLVV